MHISPDRDLWQIDPETRRVAPAQALGTPVLLVIDSGRPVHPAIAEVCDFLQVSIFLARNALELPGLMAMLRPLGVLIEAEQADFRLYDMLMVLAAQAPDFPAMVVMPDRPANRSAIEAAARLWQVRDLTHVDATPDIRPIIDFLFRAGRRCGGGGRMAA